MKKVLIIILTVILLALAGIIIFEGIDFGFLKIESIYDIKSESAKLDENLAVCVKMTNTDYPSTVDDLEAAIKTLKQNKQKYEALEQTNEEIEALKTIEIKEYKSEFLWTTIGNLAKNNGIDLTLELTQGTVQNSYNIKFIASGKYIGIIDFVYDLEENEDLSFTIENFEMTPTTKKTGNQKTINNVNTVTTSNNITSNTVITGNNTTNTAIKTEIDTTFLTSTFSVLDIGIELD